MVKPVKITDIVINLPWEKSGVPNKFIMLGNGLKNKNYISCMLRSEDLRLQTKNEFILVQGFLTFVVHVVGT